MAAATARRSRVKIYSPTRSGPVLMKTLNEDTVRQLIREAKNSKSTTLDLNAQALDSLQQFKELSDLKQLAALYLLCNSFKSLPKPVCRLNNLKVLDLSSNQLVSVPTEICKLKNLRELYLLNNRLKTLPDSMKALFKLKNLGLSGNAMPKLPPVVFEFPQLEVLWLNYNLLTDIPEELFTKLGSLRKLSLGYNKLTRISQNISKLKKLETLMLRRNRLGFIPAEQLEISAACECESNPLLPTPRQIEKRSGEKLEYYVEDLWGEEEMVPSLKELCLRAVKKHKVNHAHKVPYELSHKLKNHHSCSRCKAAYFDDHIAAVQMHKGVNFDVTELPVVYRLCSETCLRELLKVKETYPLNWLQEFQVKL